MQTARCLCGELFLSGELVPEAVDREDVLRRFRIAFDLLPQARDVHVDGPRQRHLVVAPDVRQQRVARQGRAPVLDEIAQQLELACREIDRLPRARHFHAPEVEDDARRWTSAPASRGRSGSAARLARDRGGPHIAIVQGGDADPLGSMPSGDGTSTRHKVEIYAQGYNLLNHTNALNFSGVMTSPFFGQATSAASPRRVEIGTRLTF